MTIETVESSVIQVALPINPEEVKVEPLETVELTDLQLDRLRIFASDLRQKKEAPLGVVGNPVKVGADWGQIEARLDIDGVRVVPLRDTAGKLSEVSVWGIKMPVTNLRAALEAATDQETALGVLRALQMSQNVTLSRTIEKDINPVPDFLRIKSSV